MKYLEDTVTLRYSAPAFNIYNPAIRAYKHDVKRHFYSYLYVSINENFGIEHSFDQSLEMRCSGVYLY